jgi:hypothetical protein
MHPLYVVANIEHYTREDVKYQWKTYRQKGRVNEKQPYFTDRYIEAFAQVGANPEGVPFKKCKYPL